MTSWATGLHAAGGAGITTVLGLGNTLLGDDGIGVRVAEALLAQRAPGLRAIDGGTMGFRLADTLARSAACICVDAADLGAAPGTVRQLSLEDLTARFATGGRSSAHEAGLLDLLGLVRLEGRLPPHLAIVAIQPAVLDWGETLSPVVAAALPRACEMVLQISRGWSDAK
ncbi:hydrogenase maturation protease [Pseudooceanicola sp. CBS1P-1]|uniref:Hydrogenase maturation protease n=1 Tax=Pseudooceanicola albus TaxID=2692189 RepID=A0A6L7G9P2_9RHOB|nr:MULTISPECIES: hydrogenase maturation protease [Pseudooceanicola]MBT9386267.1 hydrogenase maturation protease [Pseudooceanicola endophyticus]MXN20317.1 hydrogenase maturation protease [Pseudooceanicola albus]